MVAKVAVAICRVLANVYIRLFSSPRIQFLNNALIQLGLRGRGYNNYQNYRASGEAHFIEVLSAKRINVCLDVGANVGDYTRELLRKTNAQILAFEPLPSAFQRLEGLALDNPERLFAFNCGLAEEPGQRELYFGIEHTGLASFSTEVKNIEYVGRVNTESVMAAVTTLDEFFAGEGARFCFDRIDLLKIDTEGDEANVLLGGRETLKRLRPRYIQIEFNLHQLFRSQSLWSISRLLDSYTPYQLLPYKSGFYRLDPKRPENNIFEFSNVVFVSPDSSISAV